ncbi:polysaccharide export protein EpsE [Pseudorhodoferax sp.]|uniref:polysaccharide export protein EpsE n=1 Tax=Pseudorhodoferax sp. TaxID=1993553 RepID=UPI002DD6347F|nr:polysaccharide export protein EpsE [Pseudorhodoferax sp.]
MPHTPTATLPCLRWCLRLWFACLLLLSAGHAAAQPAAPQDYRLGAGDTVRLQVFQNPDLTVEARVSESGAISVPLIGSIAVGGASLAEAERRIADAFKSGGFLQQPQVNLVLLQVRSNQVSVLGQVNRPGRFVLETANMRLTDLLALAGGAMPGGDDTVVLSGTRNGQPFRRSIDVPALFLVEGAEDNPAVSGGDTVYVPRAPMFYIYGEAQRPGAYRIERGMTVMQALATGGGPTNRGSETRLRLHRRDAAGQVQQSTPDPTELLRPNDVLYVRESLF